MKRMSVRILCSIMAFLVFAALCVPDIASADNGRSTSITVYWDEEYSSITVTVKGKADGETYTVKWYALSNGESAAKSDRTSASSYTATGLEPNTEYLITLECEAFTVSFKARTRNVQPYSDFDDSFEWSQSSSIYLISDRSKLFKHLDNGRKVSTFIDQYNLRKSKERIISLDESFLKHGAAMFAFLLYAAPKEELNGKPYTLLMRVNGGSVRRDGIFGDMDVSIDRDCLYVLVYDMFEDAAKSFPNLSGSKFTLELLIDGMSAVDATGWFE
ncbi:MAG: fibronectin type III domain-containing protein [Clostridiales bacterium]|nr:fibronectin type III domain-containing protein [Clostridiales bacterium]